MLTDPAVHHRADWLFGLVCLLFGGLGWRLWDLQVVDHPAYAETQHDQTWTREEIPAQRGRILFRDGDPTALSKSVESVCLDPGAVTDPQRVASTLAQILGVSKADLLEDLLDRREVAKLHSKTSGWIELEGIEDLLHRRETARGLTDMRRAAIARLGRPELTFDGDRLLCATRLVKDRDDLSRQLAPFLAIPWSEVKSRITPTRSFIWAKRRVSPSEADAVRKAALPGVEFRDEYKRFYPLDSIGAPQVVGIVGIDGVGLGGVERAWDRWLAGKPGSRKVLRDARQKPIPSLGEVETPALPGCDVTTAMDPTIQFLAEQEMDDVVRQWSPKAATCIVMDPRTGEVLALVCRPTFNPNYAGTFPAESQKNRAITDPCEPGSTFKGVVFSGALQERLLSLTESMDCEGGSYTLPWGRTIHDHHPYGLLSMIEVITKSSNIGMAKIGMRLGATRLYRYVTGFGFGSPTGIGLPGESGGTLRLLRAWTPDSTPSIAFGHEVSVTPMQLATAYCAIANGGWLLKPQIVLRVTDDRGGIVEESQTKVVRQVIAERTASSVQEVLTQVVEKGTGTRAKVKGYSVAGKTGTAQKLLPDGHYSHEKYVSSFLAFAPAHEARVLVLISVDEPRGEGILYGGTVAAPHVGALLGKVLRHLEVDPDRPDQLTGTEEEPAAGPSDAHD